MKKVIHCIILPLICVIIAAALAFTNSVTSAIIVEREKREQDAARIELLSEGDSFAEVKLDEAKAKELNIIDMYAADNGAGYVVQTTASGYGGPITVMTGIRADGTVEKVKVLSSSETPGVGKKTEEESFLGQFADKSGTLAVGSDITAVSGATVSSKAMVAAVNSAVAAVELVKGGSGE